MKYTVIILSISCLWTGVQSGPLNMAPQDPDFHKNTSELILSHGFSFEKHDITTRDGYILSVYRIVHRNNSAMTGRPYMLQHGLSSSSIDWILNSPYKASDYHLNVTSNNIGFEFAKRGYDVWLTNSRGNSDGQKHKSLTPKDSKFWDFSFDDMIKYDLPDTIDYILKVTQAPTMGYIGHSQGTMIMFGLMSEQKKYNDLIKPFIALAPVAYVGHIRTPLKNIVKIPYFVSLASNYKGPFTSQGEWGKKFVDIVCRSTIKALCESMIYVGAGWDSGQANMTRLPVYLSHFPAGTSMKNIIHFMMNVKSQKFNKYDYEKKNMDIYNQNDPPSYNLNNVINPDIILLNSENDLLSDPEDVQLLRNSLGVKPKYDQLVTLKKFNHLDFLFAMDAKSLVVEHLVQWAKPYDH